MRILSRLRKVGKEKMIKLGWLLGALESHKNHYGYDHPVYFRLNNGNIINVEDIHISNNELFPDVGTVITIYEKKEDI